MVRPGVTTRNPRVKFRLVGSPHGVHRLPGDEHRHDRRLAGAGRQLQRQPREIGIRLLVRRIEPLEDLAHVAPTAVRRDLGQPDCRLDRLDLAEERTDVAELVVAPVFQEARGLGCDIPLRLGQGTPQGDFPSDHVDGRRRVVLLLFGGEPLPLVEHQLRLSRLTALLPRARHGRDVGRRPALVEDPVRGLASLVELPVPGGVLVGRVQDRGFEERVCHGAQSSFGANGAGDEPHTCPVRAHTAAVRGTRIGLPRVGRLVQSPPAQQRR